jgi:hypothetical protein
VETGKLAAEQKHATMTISIQAMGAMAFAPLKAAMHVSEHRALAQPFAETGSLEELSNATSLHSTTPISLHSTAAIAFATLNPGFHVTEENRALAQPFAETSSLEEMSNATTAISLHSTAAVALATMNPGFYVTENRAFAHRRFKKILIETKKEGVRFAPLLFYGKNNHAGRDL